MSIPTYFRNDGWVKSAQGAAVPGSQIYICNQPANVDTVPPSPPSPLASIFEDATGLVPITQPIITDGFGHYDFYVAPGTYTVVVALSGVIQQVYTDQSIGIGASALTAGSGISIVGSTISTTNTITLQINGADNTDQNKLNFVDVTSTGDPFDFISFVDNGSGSISGQLLTFNGTGVFTGGGASVDFTIDNPYTSAADYTVYVTYTFPLSSPGILSVEYVDGSHFKVHSSSATDASSFRYRIL
jgi:hypothetical protein